MGAESRQFGEGRWVGGGVAASRLAPSAGFEPAHTAPEADALSPELRGRELQNSWQKTWRTGRDRSSRRCWSGSNGVSDRLFVQFAELEARRSRLVSERGRRAGQAASAVGCRRR